MSSRKCKYDADAFCYICGQFIKVRDVKYELNTSHVLCEAYEAYFDRPVRNQDKTWAPHVACSYCKRCLEGWYRGAKRSMKFAIPRIWREPKDHVNDYYFCIVNPSKRRRVAHNLTRPVPELPQKSSSFLSSHRSNSDFNDLIRDLNLPKRKAELLGSRLKQWYLLDDVNITDQQTRHETFSTFFTKEDGLCFCNDIKGQKEPFDFLLEGDTTKVLEFRRNRIIIGNNGVRKRPLKQLKPVTRYCQVIFFTYINVVNVSSETNSFIQVLWYPLIQHMVVENKGMQPTTCSHTQPTDILINMRYSIAISQTRNESNTRVL
nr:uncharacterized protein LOC111421790 isoform X4 [Onthophagus taurus]